MWTKVIYPYFSQWPVLTPRTTFPWVAKQTIVELLTSAVIDCVTHLAVGVTQRVVHSREKNHAPKVNFGIVLVICR